MRTILILLAILFTFTGKDPMAIDHYGFLIDGKGGFFILGADGIDLVDKEAKVIRHHSEQLLGHIESMDRTSFMRIMVFFSEVPGFQILDNTLSPHTEMVDLNLLGRPFTTLMCTSSSNSYWLYDGVSFELVRIDSKNREISNSGNLMNTIGRKVEPFKIIENANRVYMADKESGLLIFDQFGVYIRTVSITGLIDFTVEDGVPYMLTAQGISVFRGKPTDITELEIELPSSVSCIDMDESHLYLGDGKRIWTLER